MGDEEVALARAAAEVALARAARLARHGRYAEAAALLDGLPANLPASLDLRARIHDLRARIHAQQGELELADACWAQAGALVPECDQFAAGRRRIARLRGTGRLPGNAGLVGNRPLPGNDDLPGSSEAGTAEGDRGEGAGREAGPGGWRRLAPLVRRRPVRSRR